MPLYALKGHRLGLSTFYLDSTCARAFVARQGSTLDKIFAYVLRDNGYGALMDRDTHESAVLRICTSLFRLDAIFHVILLIVSLPLHLIPALGSIIYAWLHSTFMAWESHLYYFNLKGFNLKQQQHWIDQRKFQYTSFGFQMLLLQMIPLLGLLFIFSNTCGATGDQDGV
ncbi:unnamed protein product [Peronospora belbahrii]|uniref:Uncharacterized protein n=1 Tax=Peronospora belbahrii TaxID=622444 RepID=A0AAU9KI96_9STRA|nr:unnamed protein product [Peronospora belbahrii]